MIWITTLALVMAAALVKLGVASVMVSILTTALWATGACIAALLTFVMWQSWRR
jgi:hypothetical protein